MFSIQELVDRFQLLPHPEGGYYRETYRSGGIFNELSSDGVFPNGRNYCTLIYFMLTSESFSAFHRIKSDEIWHFYYGSPVEIFFFENGKLQTFTLGSDINNGQEFQCVVPAGSWFAARVKDEDAFSLVGCSVSPGFSFEDFELANRDDLLKQYPEYEAIIRKFTRN